MIRELPSWGDVCTVSINPWNQKESHNLNYLFPDDDGSTVRCGIWDIFPWSIFRMNGCDYGPGDRALASLTDGVLTAVWYLLQGK